MTAESEAGVDLYWLPLGAGGHSVRLNGRLFEAVAARLERRSRCDLYHSALEVRVPEGRCVIEQAPVRDSNGGERGVVAEGAVGSRWAGRLRIFRYEVRRWYGGVIPDVAEAVESPQRLTDDPQVAQRVLDLAADVPTPVWGRDELAAGEMWNSNSLTAWLIARGGLTAESIQPPAGGRAPGWRAGLVVARRPETLPDPARRAAPPQRRRRAGARSSSVPPRPEPSGAQRAGTFSATKNIAIATREKGEEPTEALRADDRPHAATGKRSGDRGAGESRCDEAIASWATVAPVASASRPAFPVRWSGSLARRSTRSSRSRAQRTLT